MEQKDTAQQNTAPNGQSLAMSTQNDFYHKHFAVSVIAKKTEKIATALYMVTDFVHESEPLRSQLRTLSVALIAATRRIGADVSALVDETKVFLNLAVTIGIISEMNGRILITELDKVRAEIGRRHAGIVLTPEMFEAATGEKVPPHFDKGQEVSKGQNQVSAPVELAAKKGDIGIKIARRNDVLNVVKSKGRTSIKEVVSTLKDISEKTVQRELLALVKEGVLVKEGEKRWSTYRVAS